MHVEYYCTSGQLSGNSCIVTTYEAAERKYVCYDSDYYLSGDLCIKTDTIPINENYSCPSGYKRSGSTCIMTEITASERSYSCPSGYTLSGTTCTKTVTLDANVSYHCLKGILNGTYCITKTTKAPTNVTYACPSGSKMNSKGQCEITTIVELFKNNSCSKGYTFSNGKCEKTITTNAKETLTCPDGTLTDKNARKCYQEISIDAIKTQE